MARRDVGFTHSVDVRDRRNRSDSVEQNSVASEGLERYTTTTTRPTTTTTTSSSVQDLSQNSTIKSTSTTKKSRGHQTGGRSSARSIASHSPFIAVIMLATIVHGC